VPAGFAINVFAEGLDAYRFKLTPYSDRRRAGSRETRRNRIWLQNTNGDGVADVRKTTQSETGLNIPFLAWRLLAMVPSSKQRRCRP